ncbi:MAG: M48 family metalloprotease [Pseudomonadales bacterium]|nr:M48 family metalloprotease [Pseudomonadales bacterium]
MARLITRAGIAAAALLLAVGVSSVRAAPADDLPVLGDLSSSIVSPEMEAQIGADFMRQIRAQLPTQSDPLITYWTEELLFRLAAASDLRRVDLNLVLIDSPAINAFAAPGGIVGINYGTYAQAPTVHEFSAILAHELAHLSQRHFARGLEEQRKATLPFLAALLASAAIMATAGGDAGMAALASSQAIAQDNQLRYSRSREREADRLGIETLVRAGMDPWAMAGMFERMTDFYRYSRRPPEFLLTHPVTESRISDARIQASGYARRPFDDSLEFQLMRARVRLELADSPAAAADRFRSELAQGSGSFPEASRYGLALALIAQGRVDEAETELAPLLGPGQSLAYTLAQVDIEIGRGETGQALTRLERELRFTPDALPLRVAYAETLGRAGRHAAAQAELEGLAQDRPNDASVWFSLAETAGLAGDIIEVHRARAEYFQLHGSLQSALQHLQYALQLVENDYPMTARLNQRMQDIREMRQRAAS